MIMLVPFIQNCLMIFQINMYAVRPGSIVLPEKNDLWMVITATGVFMSVEYYSKAFIYPQILSYCKVQDNLVERDLRIKKASYCIYKFFYYIFSTLIAYYILKD